MSFWWTTVRNWSPTFQSHDSFDNQGCYSRYKTMQKDSTFPRRWVGICHGLPLKISIEKNFIYWQEKAIEEYGIDNLIKLHETVCFDMMSWKKLVRRAGRWVDMENDYHLMDSSYTESVWWSFKTLKKRTCIHEAFKVMLPFCPRCQTSLSNFGNRAGVQRYSDISAYVLFSIAETKIAQN